MYRDHKYLIKLLERNGYKLIKNVDEYYVSKNTNGALTTVIGNLHSSENELIGAFVRRCNML